MKELLLTSALLTNDEFVQVQQTIDQPAYTLGDIDEVELTSGNLYFWKELLLTTRTKSKGKDWARFTFIDYVWLKLILYLNDIGIAKKTDKIKLIKQCLGDVSALIPSGNPFLVTPQQDMSEEERIIALDNAKAYRGLGIVIAHSIATKLPYAIQVFRNGVCKIVQGKKDVAVHKSTNKDDKPTGDVDSDTFIQISLMDIFIDFVYTMQQAGRGKDPLWIGLVSGGEGALLDQLYYKIVTELTIKLKGEKPKSSLVKDGIDKELGYNLAKVLVEGTYQKITYKMIGGGRPITLGGG